jgi:lipoyl(octanoyl) transferase
MQKPICEVHHLGISPYEPVWRLQDELAAEIAAGKRRPTLLLLEHNHTYTFGRRGRTDNLIWDEEDIIRRGIHVHWVDRGGDVTYHGPGQLVGYPLLPLETKGLHPDPVHNSGRLPQADYVGYLRRLEATLIESLAVWGVQAHSIPGLTGVWVHTEGKGKLPTSRDHTQSLAKIAAIGVKVDVKGITRHGFALNVNPDMRYWQGIIACGLDGYEVTSLEKLIHPTPPMQSVIDDIVDSFGRIFGYNMLPAENPISV